MCSTRNQKFKMRTDLLFVAVFSSAASPFLRDILIVGFIIIIINFFKFKLSLVN